MTENIYVPAKVSPGGLREADNQAAAKDHTQETGSNRNLEQSRHRFG